MAKDWQELEQIDLQLTEQGARYPVYEWVYKPDWPIRAKFEQFLSGKKDFQDEGFDDPLARKEILVSDSPFLNLQILRKFILRTSKSGRRYWDPLKREAIIREMAKVHSTSVDGINKMKHRTFQVGEFKWNTYHVQLHIGKLPGQYSFY